MFFVDTTEANDGDTPRTVVTVYTDEVAYTPAIGTAALQWRLAGTTTWSSLTPEPVQDAARWKWRFDLPWAMTQLVECRAVITRPVGQPITTRTIPLKLA